MTSKRHAVLASRKKSDIPVVVEVRGLIVAARKTVAAAVNASLTTLNWQIGTRIRRAILREKRAGYGEETFQTLSGKLSWSHFIELLSLDKPHQRDFYAEMCRLERWSVRTLRLQIDGMLYERIALSKKPAKLIEKELTALRTDGKLTPSAHALLTSNRRPSPRHTAHAAPNIIGLRCRHGGDAMRRAGGGAVLHRHGRLQQRRSAQCGGPEGWRTGMGAGRRRPGRERRREQGGLLLRSPRAIGQETNQVPTGPECITSTVRPGRPLRRSLQTGPPLWRSTLGVRS